MSSRHVNLILGAGVTGLAAGTVLDCPVLEANDFPGGICASYYVDPKTGVKTPRRPHEETYRFEVGGGHWIFGGDPSVLKMLDRLSPLRSYQRRSSVYFADRDLFVPYPLQNNLVHLGGSLAASAVAEMALASRQPCATMAQWLRRSFGESLTSLFFGPFHELYTAGLWHAVAPQDAYKSPVQLDLVVKGAVGETPPVGYNANFRYPRAGLDALCDAMSRRCDVRYGKRVRVVDTEGRVVYCEDGTEWPYENVLSTLPLSRMLEFCDLADHVGEADPHTGVEVINIGAKRGPRCPEDHWIYLPKSDSGFHRVGFYSNVDRDFVPRSSSDRVSVYVEAAFNPGARQTLVPEQVVAELRRMGFIEAPEVVDSTRIDVAYTWSRPASTWRCDAMSALLSRGVLQVGRYGRWCFAGIASSVADGLVAGASLRVHRPTGPR